MAEVLPKVHSSKKHIKRLRTVRLQAVVNSIVTLSGLADKARASGNRIESLIYQGLVMDLFRSARKK